MKNKNNSHTRKVKMVNIMAMNAYARNRMVAWKKAAQITGLSYETVKAAYKAEDFKALSDEEKKAVNIAHNILRNYGKAYKANTEAAPAETVAEEAVAEA